MMIWVSVAILLLVDQGMPIILASVLFVLAQCEWSGRRLFTWRRR